jgi:hypothetical protein
VVRHQPDGVAGGVPDLLVLVLQPGDEAVEEGRLDLLEGFQGG